MAKEYAKKFYNSKVWKQTRESYIASVYGLCERCSKPGYIVHHKKEITPANINDPMITLSHSNLEYLCLNCHNREHGDADVIREGLEFDDNGDIVEVMKW